MGLKNGEYAGRYCIIIRGFTVLQTIHWQGESGGMPHNSRQWWRVACQASTALSQVGSVLYAPMVGLWHTVGHYGWRWQHTRLCRHPSVLELCPMKFLPHLLSLQRLKLHQHKWRHDVPPQVTFICVRPPPPMLVKNNTDVAPCADWLLIGDWCEGESNRCFSNFILILFISYS